MKNWIGILLLTLGFGKAEARLAVSQNSVTSLIQKTNTSLLYSTQAMRGLDDHYIDLIVDRPADMVKVSCAVVKDILSQFAGQIQTIKVDFEQHSAELDKAFQKDLGKQLQSLSYLTNQSLEKCAEPDVITRNLEILRNELMTTGILIQAYKSPSDI